MSAEQPRAQMPQATSAEMSLAHVIAIAVAASITVAIAVLLLLGV